MSVKKIISIEDVCEILNDLLKIDYDACFRLVNHRETCNVKVYNHPTIMVAEIAGEYTVGIIGLLNGMFGIREDGFGQLCYNMDNDSEKITEFKPTPSYRNNPPKEMDKI